MSYQRDREECIARLTRHGLDLETVRGLLRLASTLQRLAVAQCNGDYPADNGQRETLECATCQTLWAPESIRRNGCPQCRARAGIRRHLAGSGILATFHGDPRGYVVKVTLAGQEYGIPGQEK